MKDILQTKNSGIMKKNTLMAWIFMVLVAAACQTDKDLLYSLDYITAPANVSAVFDVTQDNTGLVTVIPNAEGAQKFLVRFGDSQNATGECRPGEMIWHTYPEGTYTVSVTAVGITGLTTEKTEQLVVSFKAPENMEVSIRNDEQNPKIVYFSATADFATVFEFYFGDVADEEPTLVLPGDEISHVYTEAGNYEVTVIAKSAGAATTQYKETVVIPEASDPVNLPVNFESFTINYAFVNFGNAISSVADNPASSGINTSARVGKTVKQGGAEIWAGSFLTLENPIDFSVNTMFKMKVWSPKKGITVKMKLENLTDGGISAEVDALTTLSDEWEELSFDFSAIDKNKTYQKVVVFFDFGNTGDNSSYYFDDIKLVKAVVPASLPVQNFEGTPPAFTVFGNIPGIQVIANPDATGKNTSAHVARLEKTAGAETWAGAFFETSAPLDLESFKKIAVHTWSPKTGAVVKLKLENANASVTHEVDMSTTVSNSWEQLIFDFGNAPAADYVRMVIFFDFGKPGDGSVYYYDEIELVNESGPVAELFQDFEGTPPAFTVFGNIPGIQIINNPDATGANTTAKVARLEKSSGAETWAGAFFETSPPLDLGTYKKIAVRTWSPKTGAVVKVKLENANASITHEVDMTTTVSSSWEQLVYDFSGAPGADYVRVVIFFDFGNPGDGSVYYFDEYALTN